MSDFKLMPASDFIRLQGLDGHSRTLPPSRRWSTREEWAKQRRTAYFDDAPNESNDPADYFTPEEIQRFIEAAREEWTQLGREMKTADDGDRLYLRSVRSTLRRARLAIERGEITWDVHEASVASKRSEIQLYLEREKQHREKLYAAYAEKIAQTPIDDEAWDQEVRRRHDLEQRYGRKDQGAFN